jgi:HK97 family phage portal protein
MAWNRANKSLGNLSEKQIPFGAPVSNNPSSMTGRGYHDGWDIERAYRDGMKRVTWVFRCIDAIAGNQARLPVIGHKHNSPHGPIVKDANVLQLLNARANPGEDAFIFRYRLSSQLLMSTRGAFVEMIRGRGGDVVALNLLPPQYTSPVPDPKTFVKHFEVRMPGGGFEYVKPEDVLWFRHPHPLDPYLSLTPMESAGMAIEIENLARFYNRNFLLNDGRPGGLLVVRGDMDEDDKEELRSRFRGNLARAGAVSVIASEDGVDFVDTAASPRDASYTEMRQITKEEILAAFGVPESVIGNASGRTFSNAAEELRVFWMETMQPHLEMLARGLDTLDAELYFDFDTSKVPILILAKQEREQYLLTEFNTGLITANEYREGTGRKKVDSDLADSMLANPNLAPIGNTKRDMPFVDPNAQAGGMPGAPGAPGAPAPGAPPGGTPIGATPPTGATPPVTPEAAAVAADEAPAPMLEDTEAAGATPETTSESPAAEPATATAPDEEAPAEPPAPAAAPPSFEDQLEPATEPESPIAGDQEVPAMELDEEAIAAQNETPQFSLSSDTEEEQLDADGNPVNPDKSPRFKFDPSSLQTKEIAGSDFDVKSETARNRWEAILGNSLERFFERQQRVTLEKALGAKSRRSLAEGRLNVESVFDEGVWNRQLADDVRPVLSGIMQDASGLLAEKAERQFAPDDAYYEVLNAQTERVQKVNQTTKEDIAAAIVSANALEGDEEEKSALLKAAIIAIFVAALMKRRHRIAEIEAQAAFNGGMYLAGLQIEEQGGPKTDIHDNETSAPTGRGGKQKRSLTKTWVTKKDTRVRSQHVVLEGKSVPLKDAFEIDGAALRYPGDPLAPPHLALGCRCHLRFQ